MSLSAQKAFVADIRMNDYQKRIDLIMRHRAGLWEQGMPQDIKRGAYFVCSRGIDASENADESYFDKIIMENRMCGVGWTKGLKTNITFRIKNGPFVLVMDNHNFAMPFVFEMLNRGVISFNNRFMHVDRHADQSKADGFRSFDYLTQKIEREKLRYVLKNSNVADWTYPLFTSSVISDGLYSWIRVHEGRETWTKNILGEDEPVVLSEHILLERNEELKSSQIVDVDIDFLEHMDFMLSEREKRDVLIGNIPKHISFKLSELVPFIQDSKVTTIALSPCYIEQDRALMYVRHLLNLLGEAHSYT